MSANAAAGNTDLRLNKWLWAAHFFKTRRQAVEAINGSEFQVNGQHTKPGPDRHPSNSARIMFSGGFIHARPGSAGRTF